MIEAVRGDITQERVDAIVNAANETLLGGGGVDGAIHHAAGPELLAECRTLGGCRPGEAKATKGYRLPARFVVHTVGPIWHGGSRNEAETLAACHRNALAVARGLGCRTVAFPAISCGIYGYPPGLAAQIAIDAVREHAPLELVRFVLFNDETYNAFTQRFAEPLRALERQSASLEAVRDRAALPEEHVAGVARRQLRRHEEVAAAVDPDPVDAVTERHGLDLRRAARVLLENHRVRPGAELGQDEAAVDERRHGDARAVDAHAGQGERPPEQLLRGVA